MLAHAVIAAMAIASLSPATSSRPQTSHSSKHAIRPNVARHRHGHRKHVSRLAHATHLASATPTAVLPAKPVGFLEDLPTASLSNETDGPSRQAALDRLAAMPSLEPQQANASPALRGPTDRGS